MEEIFIYWLREHTVMTRKRKGMNNKTKKIDETLLGLLLGIFVFAVVSQLAGVFFVKSALKYSLGLWIGTVLAMGCAYHMWWSLDRNLTINADNEGGARAYAIKHSMIRYAVILLVFLGVCVTDFAYPLAAFLGIMGLKAGAYLQPVINRLLHKSSK